ncbi:MAG TPA: lysylphosphatidylglycerol synthase transmembrane domain-containing protein [Acidimicrobiales bacterium]|jgi:hypothetical protein
MALVADDAALSLPLDAVATAAIECDFDDLDRYFERELAKPRRWRTYAGLAAGIVSLVLLAPVLGHVYAGIGSVGDANRFWIVAALVLEASSFVSAWELQRLLLRTDGWREVAVPQLTANATSNVMPAGSAVGAVLQVRMLSQEGIDVTRSVISLAFTGMLTMLASLAVFPVIAVLPIGDNDMSLGQAVPFSLVALCVSIPVFVFALRSERPFWSIARHCQSMMRRISWCRPPDDLAARIVHERDAIREVLRRRLLRVSTTSLGHALGDYLALYATLLAVGMRPSPAVVLLVFVAANAAGMVPFTPGGLGFVEAGLTGALVLAGAGTEQALAAVAIYRLVSCWIPVAAGFTAFGWSKLTTR